MRSQPVSQSESRHALRVACQLPIQLRARDKTLTATVLDVSRSGCRIRVTVDLSKSRKIGYLARVHDVLGRNVSGNLRFDVLGSLIAKRLNIVRAIPITEMTEIDLGCKFEEPLTDEEATMAGLGLPALGVTEESAYRALVGPRARSKSRARTNGGKLFEAAILAQENRNLDPLVGATEGMSDGRATIILDLQGPLSDSDVATLTETLAEAYGDRPTLEVLDGSRVVWTGAISIAEVLVQPNSSLVIQVQSERS